MAVQAAAWVVYVVTVIGGASTVAGLSTRHLSRRLATGTVETTWFGREVEVYDTAERYTVRWFGVATFFLSWFVLMLGIGYVLRTLGLL